MTAQRNQECFFYGRKLEEHVANVYRKKILARNREFTAYVSLNVGASLL